VLKVEEGGYIKSRQTMTFSTYTKLISAGFTVCLSGERTQVLIISASMASEDVKVEDCSTKQTEGTPRNRYRGEWPVGKMDLSTLVTVEDDGP
jgi:hypothetical protein